MILHFWQSQPRINLSLKFSHFTASRGRTAWHARDISCVISIFQHKSIYSLSKVSDIFGSTLWPLTIQTLVVKVLSTYLHSECAKLGDSLATNHIWLVCGVMIKCDISSKSDLMTSPPCTGSGGRWERRQSYKWRARAARRATSAAQSATPCVLSCDNYCNKINEI